MIRRYAAVQFVPFSATLGLNMKGLYIISSLCFVLTGCTYGQPPDKLSGHWTLQVENTRREIVATLKIHFTGKKASSCLGSDWKQVVVDSYKTKDRKFFPVDEPLSYMLDNNKISIARNQICDAYLQLSGELKGTNVSGKYISFGWGSKDLGYFSLKHEVQ